MAFLCPVRIRRGKKKKSSTGDVETKELRNNAFTGMGRITGSASIETLVRVGIEKENGLSPDSKMIVLHDFTPCVDDELQVKRGQVVNILYRENDWVYVIAEDSRLEGFIPHSYCTPYNSHLGELALNNLKKKLPREQFNNSNEVEVDISIENQQDGSDNESFNKKDRNQNNQQPRISITSSQASLHSTSSSQLEIHPFFKDPSGRFIVLYTFIARDENDVSVERGEFITVLNREDPDWYWIIRSDGQEGFVPSGFVYPADVLQNHLNQSNQITASTAIPYNSKVSKIGNSLPLNNTIIQNSLNPAVQSCNPNAHQTTNVNEEMPYHGTELVMLYDYKAQAPDDLSVRRGDWIYADFNTQNLDGWLWAYAPKTRKCGFIPKAYARPPAMTSL
ncbi:SH3 domain-containing protein Dlish-like [Planococcus citri]|uniref:SH3 domain-containing protein Dlish-like n=1 Tax=Planococcus citri TaxID=170843 RepID=UPI0031F9855B